MKAEILTPETLKKGFESLRDQSNVPDLMVPADMIEGKLTREEQEQISRENWFLLKVSAVLFVVWMFLLAAAGYGVYQLASPALDGSATAVPCEGP